MEYTPEQLEIRKILEERAAREGKTVDEYLAPYLARCPEYVAELKGLAGL